MSEDTLIKVGGEGLFERTVEPLVISKADPSSDWLLQARADINRETSLRSTILQGKQAATPNEEIADSLGTQLNIAWGGRHAQEAYDAALYLLDEYDQLGEGVHLVSTETGRVLLTLMDEDIWDPGMIPREGGRMVKGLPRIRPDLEASITTWTFDRNREERVVETLAKKGYQTTLLKEEGDPRLLVATRRGRTQIVKDIASFTPADLLGACGGTSGAFLRYFEIRTKEPIEPAFEKILEGTLKSSSTMTISDQTTVNLHHSRAGTLRGVLAQGWARDLAGKLVEEVHKRFDEIHARFGGAMRYESLEELTAENTRDWKARFWIVPPEAMAHMNRTRPDWNFLPVALTVDKTYFVGLLHSKVGILVIPEQFGAETNEMFEKWTTSAHLDFQLYVDWSAFCYHAISGMTYQGHVV